MTQRLDRHEPGRRPRRVDRRQQTDDDSQNRHADAIYGFDFERDVRDGIDFGIDRNQLPSIEPALYELGSATLIPGKNKEIGLLPT